MRKTNVILLALVLGLAVLAGCGGTNPPGPEVFVEENAWHGGIPDDAEIVAPDEFRRLVASGDLVLTSSLAVEAASEAREAQFLQDRQALIDMGNPSEALLALLEEAEGHDAFEGDLSLAVDEGAIVVDGIGARLSQALIVAELAASPENALIDYRQTYDMLPEDLRDAAPSPESLEGRPLAEILQALHDLDAALGEGDWLDETAHLETSPVGPMDLLGDLSGPMATLRPGAGSDQDASCASPTGLAAEYWFPLKYFISPMKNQANRGTCWAFTAIGAVESRERVQNANAVNLSEQFLVNKVKEDWDSSDFVDGYFAERALNLAVDRGQTLMHEGGWTYNPSPNRPAGASGNAAAYARACDPYGVGANGGTCSETAHQSRRVCSTVIITVCGYATVNLSGGGIAASRSYQVWASGQAFDLNRYRLMLSQGYVLMASFPVYEGFMSAPRGVVSDYAREFINDAGALVPGSYGGHAVQIVGFISNAQMTKSGRPPVNIGGGGYFIVKNSWGCGSGDGGYWYVPADYVSGRFTSLHALAFDGRRSDAWRAEQDLPGGSDAPQIEIRTSPAPVQLRVSTNLAPFFRVSHEVAKSVRLKVSSSVLGTLYDGPWSTDTDALFGSTLNYAFPQVGDQYLSLEARYGTVVRYALLIVRVNNSPPTLTLHAPSTAFVGEAFPITASVADPNETDLARLCSATTWTASAPDVVLSSSSGCEVVVTFGATGSRTVSATVRDREGLTTSRSVQRTVAPAPENPYPRILSGGVYSRDARFIDGTFIGCDNTPMTTGALIDLREQGCTLSIFGDPPWRYLAAVTVENPDGEALSYDWRLWVTYLDGDRLYNSAIGSADAAMDLRNAYNAIPSTLPCHVTVTVHAPDPSRSKSATLWTGQCTMNTININ